MTAANRIWAHCERDDEGKVYIEYLSDEPWPEKDGGTEYVHADEYNAALTVVDVLSREKEALEAENATLGRLYESYLAQLQQAEKKIFALQMGNAARAAIEGCQP